MECIICGSPMAYYFSKTFADFGLDVVDYWRCGGCGFCASKTHFEMPDAEWARLNDAFHARSHASEDNPYNRNQRYFNQAVMLSAMTRHGLVGRGPWLDWGCGVGALSTVLDRYFDLRLSTYDKYYAPSANRIAAADLAPRRFDLVVNTAVFEHVRDRATLDEMEAYVAPSGVFAVHTLVPETVPRDPDWMYLLPVHCAFHTNRSMDRLMRDWGYQCSVYNEHAKLWVMFREAPGAVRARVDELNASLGWRYLHFKEGFMDFWK